MSEPLITDQRGLKRLGWPFSRAHTWRMMFDAGYLLQMRLPVAAF